VVIERAAPIVIERALMAVCGVGLVESVTWTENVVAVAIVGVPERTPAVLSVRPAGGAPAARLQVYGGAPPAALKVKL
jgi:hypothetical protein